MGIKESFALEPLAFVSLQETKESLQTDRVSHELLQATFISMQNALHTLQGIIEESLCSETTLGQSCETTNDTISVSESDVFQFGMLWSLIKVLQEQGLLYDSIAKCKEDIKQIKESWLPYIQQQCALEPYTYTEIEHLLLEGMIIPVEQGAGAAYFLLDSLSVPRYVIKPIDEDIFCLNNRKHFASPFNGPEFRVRDDIPLYRSAQTDVLSYLLAKRCGLSHITPKTVMAVISDDHFFDLSAYLPETEWAAFLERTGPIDKEKLCSAQEFIPNSRDLYEVLQEMQTLNWTDEQIDLAFDQEDFNDANLFVWLTYDNDAHPGNFRVYLKRYDASGQPVFGIKKVDNGLSFPEKNTGFMNFLAYFPNAKQPLPSAMKDKIMNIPIDLVVEDMHSLDMDACSDAFLKRVSILQNLAQREGMSCYEINLRLMVLSMPDGEELALSTMTLEEIEKLIEGTVEVDSSIEDEEITLPSLYKGVI